MFRLVLFLLMAIGAGLSAREIAATESQKIDEVPDKSTVLRLLEGYEWQLSQEAFDPLGSSVYLTLIDIIQDESLMTYTHGRATAALTLYRNETVWQFFLDGLEVATSTTQTRRAVESICEVFSDSKADQLGAVLVPLLLSEDVHVRTRTATCLGKVNRLSRIDAVTNALLAYHDSITESWEKRAAGFRE